MRLSLLEAFRGKLRVKLKGIKITLASSAERQQRVKLASRLNRVGMIFIIDEKFYVTKQRRRPFPPLDKDLIKDAKIQLNSGSDRALFIYEK